MAISSRRYALTALFGRILLGVIFILTGLSKIYAFGQTAQYMSAHGIPVAPFFLGLAIPVELIGGFLIVIGFQARYAAALLFLYLIPVTLIFHHFWSLQGIEKQVQLVNFLKNLSIMGGLLGLIANGGGIFSVDGLFHPQSQSGNGDRSHIRLVS